MVLMGIDVGNTNMKCVILTRNGGVLNLVRRASVLNTQTPGGKTYIDGERLFKAVVKMCEEAWSTIEQEKLRGIAVTSVGCAPVILNKYDQQLNDSTPNQKIEPMPHLSNEEYREICGYSKDYGCGIHNILHFVSGVTDPLTVMSVGDYLNYRFTGIKKRERSTAGSVTLLDRRTYDDWYDFMYEHRLNKELFPPLCNSGDYIGDLSNPEGTKLPVGTPVFAGGQDYLCAAFAAGCTDDGDMINVLGTYEMLASFYKTPPEAPESPAFVTFSDKHVFPGRYAVTTEMLADGTRADQVRKSTKMYLYQEQFIEEKTSYKTKIVGGGSTNRILIQSKAFMTGMRLYVPNIPEATATGAALLAGVGAGVFKTYEAASRLYRHVKTEIYFPEQKRLTS